MRTLAFFVVGTFLALSSGVRAQDQNTLAQWAYPKWETNCIPKGCILSVDVLRGYSDGPAADPKDDKEYVSFALMVDRSTKSPAMFTIQVHPEASQENGVMIAFGKSVKENGKWTTKLGKVHRISIRKCDASSCGAASKPVFTDTEENAGTVDMLEELHTSAQLFVLYLRNGKAYRTAIGLSNFNAAYEKLLKEELLKGPR